MRIVFVSIFIDVSVSVSVSVFPFTFAVKAIVFFYFEKVEINVTKYRKLQISDIGLGIVTGPKAKMLCVTCNMFSC